MNKTEKAVTGEGKVQRVVTGSRNLGEAVIEEETLSDGSHVYNVHVPAQVINCRNQIAAINFVTRLSETISNAQG